MTSVQSNNGMMNLHRIICLTLIGLLLIMATLDLQLWRLEKRMEIIDERWTALSSDVSRYARESAEFDARALQAVKAMTVANH
jgi:hypothetical protein